MTFWMLRPLGLLALLGLAALHAAPLPPPPAREFRGTWIATVHCINWPSEPGLPTARQKEQLIKLLDSAASLRINAIIFQVRPAGDAMYKSAIDPWSPYLTGKMGEPPSPEWDPLEMIVAEAHKRGIELHAWFNPYRAIAGDKHNAGGNHICIEHPEWTMKHGRDVWMNPAEPGVQDRTRAVILDVVRRYDIDGVHLDDYFYPYPVKDSAGNLVEFPDAKTYERYKAGGGMLERNAWRREGVDRLVQGIYTEIKATKRWVKFGISPFGLWRTNVPEGTGGGLDPYEDLAADSRKWLQSGWVDYLAPQLYWPIEPAKLSFTTFYDWWLSQNTAGRHIWPGMADDRIGKDRGPGEILRQISAVRQRGNVSPPGHLHWNFGSLHKDTGQIGTLTRQRAYTTLALPPPTPWLGLSSLPVPLMKMESLAGRPKLIKWSFLNERWLPQVRWWVVQTFVNGQWQTLKVLPADQREMPWPEKTQAVAIRAAGYSWEVSEAAFIEGPRS
jgi:uncharacterized lipoprotein YddW (UPF0748 family)